MFFGLIAIAVGVYGICISVLDNEVFSKFVKADPEMQRRINILGLRGTKIITFVFSVLAILAGIGSLIAVFR